MKKFDEIINELGSPSLSLQNLNIWVHGRQFPSATDYWDGNWLNITVAYYDGYSNVICTGPIVSLPEIYQFHKDLLKLNDTLKGEAVIPTIEPYFKLSLKVDNLLSFIN